jgi:hypothetical protein
MLKAFDQDIWIADGPSVAVAGFHYPTRMAVIRLPDGGLFIWSPIRLTARLQADVDAVGHVRHVVAPNSLHHLFLGEWQRAYPRAKTYAPPGLRRKRAVMSTSGGTISTTFTYDPNGNQTAGLGRSITWTSYNKPASITQGTRTINFLDDTEHQRFKQITPEGTTLYIAGFGVLAEIANPGTSSATWTE